MSTDERARRLAELEAVAAMPGGMSAIRFVAATLGAVPTVGSLVSALAALSAEREQAETNRSLVQWTQLADAELNTLTSALERLQQEPSKPAMAILLGKVLGQKWSTALLEHGATVSVVLHPSTLQELESFIERGWLALQSNGSVCSMGAGNSVGNQAEDLKRPYGIGTCFLLRAPLGTLDAGV
jgi:hypothetical protein